MTIPGRDLAERLVARVATVVRRDLTLASFADVVGRVHRHQVLVTEPDTDRTLTGGQIAELVARWSDAIAARVGPGERVVVATPNGYDQLLFCLAAARAGALAVPVNDQMRPAEIDHVRRDAGAHLVIHSVADLPSTAPVIEPATPDPDDLAALFYTSGTTGAPKGAELTHRGLVGQLSAAVLWPSELRHDEVVAALPVAHIMGFVVYLGLAAAGIPVVSLPRFEPKAVLDLIESRRCSGFVGVPAMYRRLQEAGADGRDLTSIRAWMSGADVMPPDLVAAFKGYGATATLPLVGPVGEATFVEGYGMVETAGGVAAKMSPPWIPFGLGAALGMPLPGVRLRVVDEHGHDVGLGGTGELWVRGPGVLKGYWNAPEVTRAALTDDGWLRTGDLVRLGPFGTVTFQGRGKHVIKSGGYSVYPAEVESALERHPDVVEASVVGIPDPTLGEVPAAAVRLREGSRLTPARLETWAASRLSHYKMPRRIAVVDDLPRTGTGKVQKDLVAAQLLAVPGPRARQRARRSTRG